MTERSVLRQTDVQHVKFMMPSLPDLVATAETILSDALHFCDEKTRAGGVETVRRRLSQGDNTTRSYFNYRIAQQTAEYLGAVDKNVKEAFIFEEEATEEDLCLSESTRDPLVHVLIWATRETAALKSLVQALDHALTEKYAALLDVNKPTHLLDVQIVDDSEVASRFGYGALLSSLHHRPVQVWTR